MNKNETGKISEALHKLMDFFDCCCCGDSPDPIIDSRDRCMHCVVNEALPLAEQLEVQVVSLRAELEQANKRIETLRQESQSHADTIREMVPSYMKYWAPLSAVEILCKEQEKLRAELEQERIQHAGCLTAAEGWAKDPPKKGDWAWSPAFQAALDLRAQVEQLTADKARLDWITSSPVEVVPSSIKYFLFQHPPSFKTPREAIDAAMKESQ